jgi:hypothetical protein
MTTKTVKVIVKNIVEFEVADGFELSNYDNENFVALAKKAILQTPITAIMNDGKYKVKI